MGCPLCGAAGNEGRCMQCGGNPSLAQLVRANPSLAPGLREVAERIRADEKIMAIKRLRELIPMGLKEAKDVVDGVHAGAAPAHSGAAPAPRGDMVSAAAEVIVLIRAGRKIEAIKRVREAQGLGLKEAKDVVEAMEAKMLAERPLPPKPAAAGKPESASVPAQAEDPHASKPAGARGQAEDPHTSKPAGALGQAKDPHASKPAGALAGAPPRAPVPVSGNPVPIQASAVSSPPMPARGPVPISGEETSGSGGRILFVLIVLLAAAAAAHAAGWF